MVELLTPVNFFTHRIWEALIIIKFNEGFNGHFYPNRNLQMVEVGDLAHHTRFAIKKNVSWKTDVLGFRNDEYVPDPDILFLGDSFIAGAALSQDETLPNVVKRRSQKKVYQVAPVFFNEFVSLYHNKVIGKPKLVIFEGVERNIPIFEKVSAKDLEDNPYNRLRSSSFFKNIFVCLERLNKATSYNYVKARLNHSKGAGFQSQVNKKMFFGQGIKAALPYNDSSMTSVVNTILTYKMFCDSIGAEFIFMACPNKETIYFEQVPFKKQPSYLSVLDEELKKKDVKTINLLEVFNASRNKRLLYHYDDSHWNVIATELVAQEVLRQYFDTSALSLATDKLNSSR
jgi:hypothetical protein